MPVSVVGPFRNAVVHLANLFDSLAIQESVEPWEVTECWRGSGIRGQDPIYRR
jgi:hypothetical protein